MMLVIISTTLYAQELVEFESNNKYGFKNVTGKVMVPAIYTSVNSFSEGLAAVYLGGKFDNDLGILGGGKWGFVDNLGNVVIAPQYDDVKSFSEGLCAVVVFKNKDFRFGYWGFIDKTGAIAIPFQFNEAGWFKNGLAEVNKDDRTFLIDKTGKEFVKLQDTTLNIVDDVEPKYKNGGFSELLKFISTNLQPQIKAKTAERSKTYLEIIIGTDGKVKEAKVVRGTNQEADADLLRTVKMLEFFPEVRWGKKVEVKYILNYIW